MREYYVESETREMEANGVSFFIQRFSSLQQRVSSHIHSSVEILLMTRGDFRVFADDTEYIVPEGGAVLLRSNTIHSIIPLQADGIYYVLKMTPSFVLDISSHENGPGYLLTLALQSAGTKTVWNREDCLKNRITACLNRILEEQEAGAPCIDMALKICAADILLSMLRDMERSQAQTPEEAENENLIRRMYDAIVYVNQHYAEDITAEDCSSHVFLSYSYFSRSFKRIIGKPFKEYLILTRLNHAEKELLSTEKTVTEIAADCGFNHVSYFIAMFRKMKGSTPSAFRSKMRG